MLYQLSYTPKKDIVVNKDWCGKKKKKGGGEGPESPHFIDGGHFDPLVDQARSH